MISSIENFAPMSDDDPYLTDVPNTVEQNAIVIKEPTPVLYFNDCHYFETEVKGILYAPNCNSVLDRSFVKNFHSQRFFESVVVIAPIVIIMLSIYLSRRRSE